MPFIATLYFRTAIILLIVGIGIGIHMSMAGDHSPMGAHAHLNLLGWVTSALFGAYYALHPAKAAGRLPMLQYAIHIIGLVIMIPALYVMLKGNPSVEPFVAGGSLIVYAGVILFGWIVFTGDEKSAAGARQPAE
jgi:peptidoglycan/LPS O-acetylase OafA/YrhL